MPISGSPTPGTSHGIRQALSECSLNEHCANKAVTGWETASRAPEWLLSDTQKRIVQEDTRADKERDFIGKGCRGGEQEGKGTQQNCPSTWLTVLGFMGMVLVPGFL